MNPATTTTQQAGEIQQEETKGEQSGGDIIEIVTSPQLLNLLPSLDLRKMYQAALEDDWEAAKGIIETHPSVVCSAITKRKDTALHIAAAARHVNFVDKLVKIMNPHDLELQNQYGNTALFFAAAAGTVKIAELMVSNNKNQDKSLTLIRGHQGMTPLHMAALLGHSQMVRYLYKQTSNDGLEDSDRIGIINACISTGLYEVALDILSKHKELAFARDKSGETALHILARKTCAFSSDPTQGSIWKKRLINSIPSRSGSSKQLQQDPALKLLTVIWDQFLLHKDDKEISELIARPTRLLFDAAERGNTKFIIELTRKYPDMMWKVNGDGLNIFHIAVLNRHEGIYNIVYEIGSIKELLLLHTDEQGNNLLHLAAQLAPRDRLLTVSGAALQMQRELQWFKEVEKIVQPSYRDKKNNKGQTPRSLFTEEHEKLVKQGEEWMKHTANSSMVVAALIATVVFAGAFQVPGGHNDAGSPIFLGKPGFVVFAIADSIAFISSSTSILFFSSMLTSRYSEDDFLESLPTKLVVGLTTLFVSIIAMMVAFSAALFIMFSQKMTWLPIPLAVMAGVPVFFFAILQYRLLADVLHSTYQSRFLFHPRKRMLY